MKRPMAIILAFLILGIIWGTIDPEGIWFFIISGAFFLVCCLFFIYFRKRILILLPFLFVLGYILAYYMTNYHNMLCDSLVEISANVTFKGEIVDIGKNNIVVKGKDFEAYGSSERNVKIICYFVNDPENSTEYSFAMGDNVSVSGKLRDLSPKYNPSDFDEIQYYGTRGIRYKIYNCKAELIKQNHNLSYYTWSLRNSIGSAIDNMYSLENAGILKAMLLGDKKYLSDDIKIIYKNAGIYHILAISGLHISIIAAILMLLFKKPRHSIIIILSLWAYCIFTGMSASTVRAVIMMSVFLIGRILKRRYDIISSLCFSAVILLIANPMYIKDCGFLFSYFSVAGIGLFAENFTGLSRLIFRGKNKVSKYISASLGTSLSAVSITKLVNMWFFYSFTVYDFIINLVVLPFVAVVIGCGAFSVLFYALHIKLYVPFVYIAEFILGFYKLSAKAVTTLPFCVISTGRPSIVFIILYSMFIIALKIGFIYRNKVIYSIAIVFIAAGAAVLCIPQTDTEIAYLYVGQGDGAVGTTAGKTFIVDGGGTNDDIYANDEGTYTILPYLNYIGKTRVDYAFVSHIDRDHLKGVYEIIGQIDIGEIFLPLGRYTSELYERTVEKANENNVKITYLKAGDRINIDENTFFECLYPAEEDADEVSDINDSGMLLRLTDKYNRFLFTGDLGEDAESRLKGKDIRAEVLKVGHHGSRHSSSKKFLAAVAPDLGVISCGINNVYGFPDEDTRERLESFDIPYIVTSEVGAVILRSKDGYIECKKTL